jgi:hypothetical protein
VEEGIWIESEFDTISRRKPERGGGWFFSCIFFI